MNARRVIAGQKIRAIALGVMMLFGLAAGVSAASVQFACIGDYGSDYVSTRQVANLVKGWRPDFVITTGDNNYPAGAAATLDRNVGQFYHDFIHPYRGRFGRGALTNRFFPCLGNHDWLTDEARPYLDYFALPGNERYYTFTRGPVQLFCLDSEKREPDGTREGSRQQRWLEQEMTNSRAPWRIVYFHHAPYSSGYFHGSWTNESHHMRWPFREWGAHAVLTGHDHIYERIQTNGLVYFVNGLGGDSRDFLRYPLVPGSAMQFSADFGALRVVATESNLWFRFVTVRGTVIDQYRLALPSPPRTRPPAAPPKSRSP